MKINESGLTCALLLLATASSSFAATPTYKSPSGECVPYANREVTTTLGTWTKTSWYGDSRTVSACYDSTVGGQYLYSTLSASIPKLSSQQISNGAKTYKQRAKNGATLRDLVNSASCSPANAASGLCNMKWADQLQYDDADVYVIAFGTNDAWNDWLQGRANGPAEFAAHLRSVVSAIQAKGKKALLIQPYRVCDYAAVDASLPNPDNLLGPYADAVAKVGIATGSAVAHLFATPTKCHGPDAATDMPDGLHATQSFTNKIAATIGQALDRVINGGLPPAPTLTISRAPVSATEKRQPIAGKDYQSLVVGKSFVSNWSTTDTTSISYSCGRWNGPGEGPGYQGSDTLTQFVQAGMTGVALASYKPTSDCTWTLTGPGGTSVYRETFETDDEPPAGMPTLTITRSPMPLIAGQMHYNTWRTTHTTSLSIKCQALGTGYYLPTTALPTSSALADGTETNQGIALSAWVGWPSTCTWTATGPGGTTIRRETFHTVVR